MCRSQVKAFRSRAMVGGGWGGMLLRTYRCTRSFNVTYIRSFSLLAPDHAAKRFSSFISKSPLSMNVNVSKRSRSVPFSTFEWEEDMGEMLDELEKELERSRKEREERGEPPEEDEDEDYMGMELELGRTERDSSAKAGKAEDVDDDEDDDSDDDFDDDEDEDEDEQSELQAQAEDEKQEKRYKECMENYENLLNRVPGSMDEAYNFIDEVDQFEAKNFAVSYEYKVIGWLVERLKKATGKERFMLLMKTQRALKQLEWKEKFDPENPANWGVIKHEDMGPIDDVEQDEEDKEDNESEKNDEKSDTDKEHEDLSDEENKDEILGEKIHSIDKEIKKKLAQMELSFGKQARDLEEEIKELVEQRQSLTEESKQPLYRKGFEVKLIDVNRTCKVTKGGQVHKFSAIVACGNFNGVVGYGKGKGTAVPVALQRAYAKSFQNLHYIERFKEHTIPHAVQAQFKKTKIYLWPGAVNTGMRAHKTIESILFLGGLKNVKSKVIGSRNPQNTVKALFKALNMIETPKDIQEKFGRTVVESYLLK